MRWLLWLAMALTGLGLAGCRGAMPAGPFASTWTVLERPEQLSASGTFGGDDGPGLLLGGVQGGDRGHPTQAESVALGGLSFQEALVSWNVVVPPLAGARLEMRVGRNVAGGVAWSPYMLVSEWGQLPPGGTRVRAMDQLTPEGGGAALPAKGRIATDYFASEESFDLAQCRVVVRAPDEPVRLMRLAVTLTDLRHPIGGASCDAGGTCADGLDREAGSMVAIAVPFRSQRHVGRALVNSLCSPTSVSMVLAARGIDLPLETVAGAVYDPEHDIYGNWPLNVQAAYALGVPGDLRRYSDWSQVLATFQEGTPIIASIKVKPGELRGATYRKSAGHLLVLRGFDKDGMVLVNDSAAMDAGRGVTKYRREDLEVVWLRRGKGTAYVLSGKATNPTAAQQNISN